MATCSERCFLRVQALDLSVGSLILATDTGVLSRQVLVQSVERVDLEHVVAEDGTHGGELSLQAGDLFGIGAFRIAQFFEQALRFLLLGGELGDDGVVVDLRLHLAVLIGELLIFILHFLLVDGCQLCHVFVLLLLLVEAEGEPYDTTCKEQDEDDYGYENLFVHV